MDTSIFPGNQWEKRAISELGFSENSLNETSKWISKQNQSRKHRIIVVKGGYIAAEWQKGIRTNNRLSMASAAKSLYSSVLGVAIKEGKIHSIDSKVIDYYPEYMNIKEGEGPKPGRYSKPEDKDITFRQLISNMSGYMKPGESPDKKFHYQTYGMNVLTHAIAKAYGYYDSKHPRRYPGFRKLIDDKIRKHINGKWKYKYFNFKHPRRAKTNIFGNNTVVEANARDMARMGYLWLRWGNWEGKQLIPEEYLREATKTAPNIKANCPENQWRYGYAFWVNDHGKMWPDLPGDSYAAIGAGNQNIWVCPSLDMVIVQSPGIFRSQADETNTKLISLIVKSLKK